MKNIEIVQKQYEKLREICKSLELDVNLLEIPLSKKKKERLKTLVPNKAKKTWFGFSV